VATETFYENSL